MAPRQGLILAGALAAAACKPPSPCGADRPVALEVRDGAGALRLSTRRPAADSPEVAAVCDGAGAQIGAISESAAPRLVTMVGHGAQLAQVSARAGGDPVLSVGQKASYTLHAQGELERLLDARGVPVAQLAREGEKTLVLDPGGTPMAQVELVAGRHVVAGRDGATRGYVVGTSDARAAAAFAIAALPDEAQLVLARWLDHP